MERGISGIKTVELQLHECMNSCCSVWKDKVAAEEQLRIDRL